MYYLLFLVIFLIGCAAQEQGPTSDQYLTFTTATDNIINVPTVVIEPTTPEPTGYKVFEVSPNGPTFVTQCCCSDPACNCD